MKLPPIDLSKLLILLKKEGGAELAIIKPTPKPGVLLGQLGMAPILQNWSEIILILEIEIIPLLAKGCEAKLLVAPARKLASNAAHLSLIASQILSFVPGPIGIICSLINSIVCFSTGNVVGGFLELLGCIPGGKVAGKATAKFAPKIQKILIEVVENNHSLKVIVETSSKADKIVIDFIEKYGPKTKPQRFDVGQGYGVRTAHQPSALESSLSRPLHSSKSIIEGQKEVGKYVTFNNTYGNLPKTNPWSHLY